MPSNGMIKQDQGVWKVYLSGEWREVAPSSPIGRLLSEVTGVQNIDEQRQAVEFFDGTVRSTAQVFELMNRAVLNPDLRRPRAIGGGLAHRLEIDEGLMLSAPDEPVGPPPSLSAQRTKERPTWWVDEPVNNDFWESYIELLAEDNLHGADEIEALVFERVKEGRAGFDARQQLLRALETADTLPAVQFAPVWWSPDAHGQWPVQGMAQSEVDKRLAATVRGDHGPAAQERAMPFFENRVTGRLVQDPNTGLWGELQPNGTFDTLSGTLQELLTAQQVAPDAQIFRDPATDQFFIRQPNGRLEQIRVPEEPSEAELRRQAIFSLDELINEAITQGDFTYARALTQIRDRPTEMELFDAALQFAKSPADQRIINNIRRGMAEVERPEGGIANLPRDPFLVESFARLTADPFANAEELFGALPQQQDRIRSIQDEIAAIRQQIASATQPVELQPPPQIGRIPGGGPEGIPEEDLDDGLFAPAATRPTSPRVQERSQENLDLLAERRARQRARASGLFAAP